MHRNSRERAARSFLNVRATVAAASLVGLAFPTALAAQSAETASPPPPGSMIVLRDVPTRPAQATGTGETLTVQTSPDFAFADALELGIDELDDATAALITSSTINGINQLARLDAGSATTDTLINEALSQNNLALLNGGPNSDAGSIVSGAVDQSLGAVNSAIGNALGGLNSSIGNLNGGGQ